MLLFDWDYNKALENVRKHRINFQLAKTIWQGPTFTEVDDRQDYGETRFNTLGMLPNTMTVLHITHTEDDDTLHLISARLATRSERERYYASQSQR